MAGKTLTIGRLAKQAGCKIQTIRFYEQIGLMPAPVRSEGNQRVYDPRDVDRLAFIRHSRDLGFPIESIRALLSLADRPDQSCAAADQIARVHLEAVERRLSHLSALKAELERMIRDCAGGRIGQCRVIEVLADHRRCLADRHDRGEG